MDAIELEIIGSRIFKANKLADGLKELEPAKLLERPSEFIVAARSCDGTFHSVNSEISKLIKKKKELIKKGIIREIVNAICPNDGLHGMRYLIFAPKKGKKGYLLGDITTALKKLAS